MLRTLHIRNYILIDSLDIEFPEGLQIITGSTGAGKSIMLGALSLLLGSKADASVICGGADSCVVEAEFETDDPTIKGLLENEELEWNGGRLLIRRVIHSSGRSRSFIDDCPVQLGLLSSISGRLVDIHSQHQSLMLTDKAWQLSMLDSYSGNKELREDCRKAFRHLQELKRELSELKEKRLSLENEEDYRKSLLETLENAKLDEDDELESLEEEHKSLANAEEIKSGLSLAGECLNPEEGSGILSSLRELGKQLEKLSPFVSSARTLSERVESARVELSDINEEVFSLNLKTEVSPERLSAVEERMSLLYDLLRKHSCKSLAELKETRDKLRNEIGDSENLDERIESIERSIREAESSFAAISESLHAERLRSKDRFAKEIEDNLHFLELDKAVFRLSLEEDSPSEYGTDKIGFLFDASSREPSDVAKCASGGELSRIMLCLKNLLAGYFSMPTMIFDEIDTGVSGSVADKMGSMICRMGENMQVFAITHLPQVAAKGNAHFLVTKESSADGRVRSSIKKLSPEERVMEIARMLSGSSITPEAVANAKSLLGF